MICMLCVHVVTFPSSYRGVTISFIPLTFVLSNQPIICSQLTTVDPGAFFYWPSYSSTANPSQLNQTQAPDL